MKKKTTTINKDGNEQRVTQAIAKMWELNDFVVRLS